MAPKGLKLKLADAKCDAESDAKQSDRFVTTQIRTKVWKIFLPNSIKIKLN